MRPRQVVTRILLPGLVLWAILWACNTPSIPMPPPGPESFTFDQHSEGLYTLSVDPNTLIPSSSQITVKNLANGTFVGGPVNPDGSFSSPPFYGDLGDIIQFSFVTPGDEGGMTCLILGNLGDVPVEDPRCGQ